MGEQWTTERVLSLAPDASSAKSGRELSSPGKWQNLGRNQRAVWGECQGSGAKPYQTQIDLAEPAFKCSCPSRKFPCKHSLGLFLMLAERPGVLKEGVPPGWVDQWLASRQEKAEKKAAKPEEALEKAADPAAQAKRAADREKKVVAGLGQLETWLKDVVSRGMAVVQSEGSVLWDQTAARMVDAQAPGVARLLREAADAASSGSGWEQRLLLRIARIHLLIEGYKRLAALTPALQAEVRSLVGWPQSTDEIMAQEGSADTWCVVGQRVIMEDAVRVQRTWLWGTRSRRPAMLLQFAHGGSPFAATAIPGTQFDGTLVFYAGAFPLRALVKNRNGATTAIAQMAGFAQVARAMAAYGHAMAASPWVELFPMAIQGVSVHQDQDLWYVRDSAGETLPISPRFPRAWQMLAQSGGHPVDLFGEWDGEYLLPLGLSADGRFSMLVKD